MSSTTLLNLLVATPLVLAAISCGKKNESNKTAKQPTPSFSLWLDDADKQRWIDKLSRTLRNGKETTAEESFLQLKPESDIVDYMMEDPAFVMSVLDFNTHFLGFRSEKLKLPDSSVGASEFFADNAAFYSTYSSAVESAMNVAQDGDFLSILDMGSSVFVPPLKSGVIYFGDFKYDFDETRRMLFASQDIAITKLVEISNGSKDPELFCQHKRDLFNSISFESVLLSNISSWARAPLQMLCNFQNSDGNDTPDPIPPLPENIATLVDDLKTRFKKVKDLHDLLSKENYQPKTLAEVKFLDLTEYGMDEARNKLNASRWFWTNFRNSSTNMNRKRSAYVLKRYFCDDLTPIGIEVPEAHANGDRHATDPGCQSCHYKLDPMAGFFRNYGYEGNNFEKSSSIFFDDFASKNRAEYVKQWRYADDSGWNIGYIRSVTTPELNDMAEGEPTAEDLFALIKKAPEVKQCLVRNLFHYLVGDEVTLDGGYLNELTADFVKTAEENSTLALKKSIKTIAMSKSFIEPSPAKGICYDFPAGYSPEDKPPCEVAFVLKESCQQCHSSSNNQGGLNLESWTKGEGFSHVDASGNKVSFGETLDRIEERLSTADSKKRMPLAKFMNAHDRETLYKWVNAEVGKL